MIATALKSRQHPILAHLVPMRRCNLSCTYCNEYDDFSKPVPTALVQRRLELLAALGTSAVTLSGGEPLLHPGLDEMIRCIRREGMLAELITNGYLLTPERIRCYARHPATAQHDYFTTHTTKVSRIGCRLCRSFVGSRSNFRPVQAVGDAARYFGRLGTDAPATDEVSPPASATGLIHFTSTRTFGS
jgi:hypothetical protein